jgi:hypothetical protein
LSHHKRKNPLRTYNVTSSFVSRHASLPQAQRLHSLFPY